MSLQLDSKTSTILGATFLSLLPFSHTTAFAQDAAAETSINPSAYRIDIAGRQRMLSQRMAKSVCFIEIGHDVDSHHASLEADYQLFNSALDELINGGGEHNIDPEPSRKILAALEATSKEWAVFNTELQSVLATDVVTAEAEETFIDANLAVLATSNEAVILIEQEYTGATSMELSDAFNVNLYGRQRMLTQKMAKEFCYIAGGHRVEAERTELAGTVSLFDGSLQALANGLPAMGIAPPPNDEIAAQLAAVAQAWAPLKAIYDKVAEGAEPTQDDIAVISTGNLELLSEAAKAVQLYVSR